MLLKPRSVCGCRYHLATVTGLEVHLATHLHIGHNVLVGLAALRRWSKKSCSNTSGAAGGTKHQ